VKSFVDEDDIKDILQLKIMASNDHVFKRYIYNITEEEQKQFGFEFIGHHTKAPDHTLYNLNTTYRNTYDRTVYIKTKNGWEVFLKDGSDGKQSPSGGGLGFADVSKLIDQKLSGFVTSGGTSGLNSSQVQQMIDNSLNNYTPVITSDSIEISGTFLNISGTNLTQMMHSVDNKLNNINYLENYKTKDYETLDGSPEIMYVGKLNQFNYWYVRKIITDVNGVITQYHSNISNNPTHLTYDDAWANRASLIYGNLEDLIFN
jgi:hypothetical protein